jgi:hypothetical protein
MSIELERRGGRSTPFCKGECWAGGEGSERIRLSDLANEVNDRRPGNGLHVGLIASKFQDGNLQQLKGPSLPKQEKTYIRHAEQMGVKPMDRQQSSNGRHKGNDLPDVVNGKGEEPTQQSDTDAGRRMRQCRRGERKARE